MSSSGVGGFATLGNLALNAKTFGAKGDGVSDDTVSLQAALNAVPAQGATVFIPRGTYVISAPLTVAKPTIIVGEGRNATILTNAATAGDGVVISSDFCAVREVTVRRTTAVATVTAGVGIKLTSGQQAIIENCVVSGWFDNIAAVDAYSWTVTKCYLVTPARYGLWVQDTAVPDRGDQVVSDCTFDSSYASSNAAIRYESGGGLKIAASKLLHHNYCLDVQLADGATTSVLVVSGNSIENATTAAIRLGRSGTTGLISRVVITGNQINAGSAAGSGLLINSGANNVVFAGNNLYGTTSAFGIVLSGGSGSLITGNEMSGLAKAIQINNTASNFGVNGNRFPTGAGAISVEDNSNQNTANAALVENKYRRAALVIVSTVTYTNLIQLDLATFRACYVDLTFEGLLGSVGVAARHIRVLISRGAAAATVTAIEDTAAGAAIDVQWDVVTTSGSVYFGVRRNAAAGGTQLDGNATIAVDGHAQRVTLT